jgi:hypothetical protein
MLGTVHLLGELDKADADAVIVAVNPGFEFLIFGWQLLFVENVLDRFGR